MPRYLTKVSYFRGASLGYLPPGSVLEMTEAEAALHISQGTIERLPDPEPKSVPKPALVELPKTKP